MQKKRMRIKDIEPLVRSILEANPRTRNDDNFLYMKIVEAVSPELMNVPFHKAICDSRMPNYESVRRIRQKIQASDPSLAADENVEAMRMLREEEFRSYANA